MRILRSLLLVPAAVLGVAWTADAAPVPESSQYVFWSPQEFDGGIGDGAMWNNIYNVHAYSPDQYVEASPPSPASTTCTVSALLNRLIAGVGVMLYSAHAAGGDNNLWTVAEGFDSMAARTAKMNEYSALGWGPYLGESQWDIGGSTFYYIDVYYNLTTFAAFFFSNTGGQNPVIVPQGVSFAITCSGADLGVRCFNSLVSFGYPLPLMVNVYQAAEDIDGLFSRMNGITGNGQYRSTSTAFSNYNDPSNPKVSMYPSSSIYLQLCPKAVGCPSNLDATNYYRQGSGKVAFSARMDTSIAATSIVTCTVPWDTNGAPHWVGDSLISFLYKSNAPGWISVTVSASATAKIKSGTLYLDGNGGNPFLPVGVAPNWDDYVYIFYGN